MTEKEEDIYEYNEKIKMTLFVAGSIYDRVLTVSGVASTSDGFNWNTFYSESQPFTAKLPINGLASGVISSISTLVAVSSGGYVSTSINYQTWNQQSLFNGYFSAQGVASNSNKFLIAGMQKYIQASGPFQQHAEIAQILSSPNGFVPYNMVYSNYIDPSIFYQIRYFGGDNIWIAVGQTNGNPLIVISSNGVNWTQITVPSSFNGQIIYDVTNYLDSNLGSVYFFSSNGLVINNIFASGNLGNDLYTVIGYYSLNMKIPNG